MSNVKASGSSQAQIVKSRIGYNRVTGGYVERTWEGTQSAILGIVGSLVFAEDYYTETDGPKWRAVARFSKPQEGSELPVDDIRMEAHRQLKSIYSHPNFESVSDDDVRAIREAIATNSKTAVFANPDSVALYQTLLAGTEHYPVYQPVLVKTRAASSQYAYSVSYANVGSVILPENISKDADVTGLLSWNLPADVSDDARYTFGWLKHLPSVTTVAGNKRALVQEYEYGRWSALIYTVA